MGGTSDYCTLTTEAVLRRAVARATAGAGFTLDRAFQGLPDTAHGGSVLAAFDALAGHDGVREVRGTYHKRVPLDVPLALATTPVGDSVDCTLFTADGTDRLVDGRVAAATDGGRPGEPPAIDGPGLPLSKTCFACGTDNPLGLRVQLVGGDDVVGTVWTPGDGFATAAGTLAPVAITTLLDEAAFWLGALASGEAGMTTGLAVRLLAPVPFGAAVTVAGRRDAVRRRADDGRYWDTSVAAWAADGRPVAAARITFVAVRGAARRLVGGLLAMNPPEVLRRVFPAYTR